MPYCLKPGHTVARDIHHIIARQLARAEPALDATSDPTHDHAVHEARRHLKKTLAALRLVRSPLGSDYAAALARIKIASRMLAPIADAEALVDTVDALCGNHALRGLDRADVRAIRTGLAQRQLRVDRKATVDDVLKKVKHLLAAQRQQIEGWSLQARGFESIAPGLERTVRKTRRAMEHTIERPTSAAYHAWRRRVKDLWFQVRLVERRCGYGLSEERSRLETLDELLGQCHNLSLLQQALVADPPVSRPALARCLRIVRSMRADLRRQALAEGAALLRDKPRTFVRRVEGLWNDTARHTQARETPPCPRT